SRPKTACGYVKHIYTRHRMSLHTAGINYLLCSCGLRATSNSSFTREHSEKCDGHEFKIIRLRSKWKVKLENVAD
ncbi:hypothetical protein PRIPAC_96997, partial [Pristionchus pacificus]|uniref:Uncharacterized protein n=1 Tax=Pristionchus pacificus TaxID=54126 RepID=A0A2A6D333_PRIPA